MEPTEIPLLLWITGLGVAFAISWFVNNWISRRRLTSAEAVARRIKMEAEHEAEALRKTVFLEAKDEWFKEKLQLEQELDEKNN